MRLYKENVERIAESPAKIAKLKAEGFQEMEALPEAEADPGNVDAMNLNELRALAKKKGLNGYASLAKSELLAALKDVV